MPPAADWLPLGTAFVLGVAHALEVDHMVAVSAFVASGPALATAARFGLRWGAGHALAVLAAGSLLLASGLRLAERHEAWGEAVVGVMLVAVGAWAFITARRFHAHPPAEHGAHHGHLHRHAGPNPGHHHGHGGQPPRAAHAHRHGITAVGLVHGLAGTSAVVALVPVTLMDRATAGVAYLVAFGAGTILAMTAFAVLAALAVRSAAARSVALGRGLSRAVGVAGVGVGIWWVVQALG